MALFCNLKLGLSVQLGQVAQQTVHLSQVVSQRLLLLFRGVLELLLALQLLKVVRQQHEVLQVLLKNELINHNVAFSGSSRSGR